MARYRFGKYRLDPDRMELWNGDQPVAVEPQVFSLLQFLVEQRERVVSKDELIDAVWQGRIISDATLNTRINAARRALGDSGKKQSVIRTLPRRGFRFIAEVADFGSSPSVRSDTATNFDPVSDEATVMETSSDIDMQLPDKPSIVVLPFTNLSDDPQQEYFSDGITEDITTALSQIRWLFVIARNSAFSYKDQARDVRQVAMELGVRYVLEGSVRKAGERVRVSAQLIDGTSGHQVWGNRYDQTLADIFQLQDVLTETIMGAIEPELGRAEQQRARLKKTDNLDSWDLCQQGMWHLYRRGKNDLVTAQLLFDQAYALDPLLSASLTGSVDAHYYEVVLGHADDASRSRKQALEKARQAIEIDTDDAAAHNAMGKARIVRREHSLAIPELELALEINPSLAWAHYGLGAATIFSGSDPAGTLSHVASAIRLSPRDAHMSSFMVRMADAYLAMNEYEAAVNWARKALREPGFQWSRYTVLASALGHMNEFEQAQLVRDELRTHRSDVTISFVRDWHLYTENETFTHYLDGLCKAGFES
jgi:TolB-like protein